MGEAPAHLIHHLRLLIRAEGETNIGGALTLFYVGVAIAAKDPEKGRRILRQLEREMASSKGYSPEQLEVEMRTAAERIRPYLESAVTDG